MDALKKEFCELARRSGWNQAEIARKLDYTRGGINGIVTGKATPSKALVHHFRLLLAAERPELKTFPMPVRRTEGVIGPDSLEMEEVIQDLREILAFDAEKFTEIQKVIRVYHIVMAQERRTARGREKLRTTPTTSSKRPSEGRAVLSEIAEKGLDS